MYGNMFDFGVAHTGTGTIATMFMPGVDYVINIMPDGPMLNGNALIHAQMFDDNNNCAKSVSQWNKPNVRK